MSPPRIGRFVFLGLGLAWAGALAAACSSFDEATAAADAAVDGSSPDTSTPDGSTGTTDGPVQPQDGGLPFCARQDAAFCTEFSASDAAAGFTGMDLVNGGAFAPANVASPSPPPSLRMSSIATLASEVSRAQLQWRAPAFPKVMHVSAAFNAEHISSFGKGRWSPELLRSPPARRASSAA